MPKFQPNPNVGPGDVIVHGKFGGNIFGFEIDPNGTEGLLCEAVGNPDGTVTAAVETFNQATGSIIRFSAGRTRKTILSPGTWPARSDSSNMKR